MDRTVSPYARVKSKLPPAMAAGVSKTLWSLDDIVAPMDATAPEPGPLQEAGSGVTWTYSTPALPHDRPALEQLKQWVVLRCHSS